MNKKQFRIYEKWLNSDNHNLHDCYKNPSNAKLAAEYSVIRDCISQHGKRFRIVNYNRFYFTCAYAVEKNGKVMLVWDGPYEREIFEIPTDWSEV